MTPLKKGAYVTDASASGRHYPAVYRLLQPYGSKQWLVEHVGDVIGGRVVYVPRRGDQTYRLTENLKEYK
jgi:hypothetical protein